MWKILKGIPRVIRHGGGRSTPAGHQSILAEDEEIAKVQALVPQINYICHQDHIRHQSSKNAGTKFNDGPDKEWNDWQNTFRQYSYWQGKQCIVESIGWGAALALGIHLIHYPVLATGDGCSSSERSNKSGTLACLYNRLVLGMPLQKIGKACIDNNKISQMSEDQDAEKLKNPIFKSFEEACNSFLSMVNRYAGMAKNIGGLEKNSKGQFDEAVEHWRVAAESGYAKANYNLGVCYEIGKGTSKNLDKAVQHYQIAAEAGHAQAQFNLAMFMLTGHDVKTNKEAALNLLEAAAEQGLCQAQTYLGVYYMTGEAKDFTKAATMFENAVAKKDIHAHFLLGLCYEKGCGVEQNESKAAKMFAVAAKAGHAEAQYNLGVFFENGLGGLPIDTKFTKELYHMAAKSGVKNAKYNLQRLQALETLNLWTAREKMSTNILIKTTDSNRSSGMHISHSTPNLVGYSDENHNKSIADPSSKQIKKSTGIKFSLGDPEEQKESKYLFDLKYGNFGVENFSIFKQNDDQNDILATETDNLHEEQGDSRCMPF